MAGAGGGFDVYAGLPLYSALRREGKQVFLANLTFTYVGGTDAQRLSPSMSVVDAQTRGEDHYFPERCLARFLSERGEEGARVFTFEKTGVAPLLEAYRHLVASLDLDAIVLVDGGTDILMRGDEAGLGTPAEDMVSLAAVAALESVPTRLVYCLGFGIDAYHGVCHAHFLENVAALSGAGAFVGAASLVPAMPEARTYLDAVAHAEGLSPGRTSIVNGSIASALEGHFGDHHRTPRTQGSELFINPLMLIYWAFDLPAVADRSLYLSTLTDTETIWDVQARIEAFRQGVQRRERRLIPH